MLNALLNYIVPFLCGLIVSFVVSYFTRNKAVEDGVQCLLRANIIEQAEKWIDRGYCPVYAKEALTRAYKAYHALKGNDVATSFHKQVMALPEKKRETEDNK
ncbi:MAG: hypothetical protein IKU30_02215 [Clostridia bacterium]|nr:hypothetical protein [Clostridia bacterium]